MKRKQFFLSMLIISVLLLAGCSKSAAYDSGATNSFYAAESMADSNAYSDGFYPGPTAATAESGKAAYGSNTTADTKTISGSNTTGAQDPVAAGRKLIKNADLSIETLEFEQSCTMIESMVSGLGGYIENSSVSDKSIYSYSQYRPMRVASYVLRIPNEFLDSFLNSAGDIGNVVNQSTSARDITLEYVDLEARSQSLEIQQERLLALLEKAETVEDIISLEDRLSTVRYQLEAQKSQLKNYDNLVSFSTVSIHLNEVQRVTQADPETVGERISSGLSDTFYDLGEWFKDFAVGFIVNLPYIVIWAVVILVVILIITKIVKRSRKNKIERAAAAQEAWASRQTNTGYTAPANAPVQQTGSNPENKL